MWLRRVDRMALSDANAQRQKVRYETIFEASACLRCQEKPAVFLLFDWLKELEGAR